MILEDFVFFYLLIGLLTYAWAFLVGRDHNEPLDVLDILICMFAWPVLLCVAFGRAAKKRDQWRKEDE